MAYQIVVSNTFSKNVSAVYLYLQAEWSQKVPDEFVEILLKQIQSIANTPGIGSPAKKPGVRKLLVTTHNKLYYRVNADHSIVLLTLFDTRKNPGKNRYE